MSPNEEEVIAFVTTEAALLDAGDLESWLTLYDHDCRYWIPSEPGQTDPDQQISIVYDDRDQLSARVARLCSGKEYAQLPPSVTCHQLSNLAVCEHPFSNMFSVKAIQVVYEKRPNTELQILPGRVSWQIRRRADGLRITRKRVEILDVHRYFENLTFLL